MNNNTKAAKKKRHEAMQARGHYRYDNMSRTEREAYVAKFGKPPAPDVKIGGGLPSYSPLALKAYRKWAAQAPGQHPYTPPTPTPRA